MNTQEQETIKADVVVDAVSRAGGRGGTCRILVVALGSGAWWATEIAQRLREDGLALADEASRIGLDGVADLAEVLSPEQRIELLELAHRFHGGEPPYGD